MTVYFFVLSRRLIIPNFSIVILASQQTRPESVSTNPLNIVILASQQTRPESVSTNPLSWG